MIIDTLNTYALLNASELRLDVGGVDGFDQLIHVHYNL